MFGRRFNVAICVQSLPELCLIALRLEKEVKIH